MTGDKTGFSSLHPSNMPLCRDRFLDAFFPSEAEEGGGNIRFIPQSPMPEVLDCSRESLLITDKIQNFICACVAVAKTVAKPAAGDHKLLQSDQESQRRLEHARVLKSSTRLTLQQLNAKGLSTLVVEAMTTDLTPLNPARHFANLSLKSLKTTKNRRKRSVVKDLILLDATILPNAIKSIDTWPNLIILDNKD